MTSALRGREGVGQFLTKGREVAWIGTDKREGGGQKSRDFSRRHMYRVEQKKTLLSSVTHVPSGLMGCALAALGLWVG